MYMRKQSTYYKTIVMWSHKFNKSDDIQNFIKKNQNGRLDQKCYLGNDHVSKIYKIDFSKYFR